MKFPQQANHIQRRTAVRQAMINVSKNLCAEVQPSTSLTVSQISGSTHTRGPTSDAPLVAEIAWPKMQVMGLV